MLDSDKFIEILMKYVRRLTRSKDESISRENEIISELQEKNDEFEIWIKDKFLKSQRIELLTEKPRFEETILRIELLAKKTLISVIERIR